MAMPTLTEGRGADGCAGLGGGREPERVRLSATCPGLREATPALIGGGGSCIHCPANDGPPLGRPPPSQPPWSGTGMGIARAVASPGTVTCAGMLNGVGISTCGPPLAFARQMWPRFGSPQL